ncbi:MAG: VWA domain-containing protein [Bryobacteraceae bacterium]|jgi:VWFA-related protein
MGRALVLALGLAACLAAQEPTFRTGISIVEIDAQVFDKAGIIDGLKQGDFAVTDDHQLVSLRYCIQEETPLDLLFLIELSKIMAPNRLQLRGAAEAAIAAMREGDRVGVLSFNECTQIEAPLTEDLKEVRRHVRTGLAYAAFAGKPFVLPAVAGAAKYLAAGSETHGRRAILMFGANAGFGLSNQNHIGVAKDLWNTDTILSAVVIPTSWTRFIYDDNPYHIFGLMALAKINRFDYVDDIAEQTGGETIYTEDAGPIRAGPNPYVTLQQAIQRMRRRYRLYYDMPEAKPGQRRRVEIELTPAAQRLHPGARIVGRKGYVVPKRAAAL